MAMIAIAFAVGIGVGVFLKAIGLPVPVPHSFAGVMGLVGMFLGAELVPWLADLLDK
jgi:XapX domain-containing protein